MKAFNLAEALAGKPVQTRDGRKMNGIYHFANRPEQKQSVVFTLEGLNEIFHCDVDGRWYTESIDNAMDLFMVSEKKYGWIAINRNINSSVRPEEIVAAETNFIYSSKEALEARTTIKYTKNWKVVQIHWEE